MMSGVWPCTPPCSGEIKSAAPSARSIVSVAHFARVGREGASVVMTSGRTSASATGGSSEIVKVAQSEESCCQMLGIIDVPTSTD